MAPADVDLVLWSGDAVNLAGWSTSAAPRSRSRLSIEDGPRGRGLRFDFELAGPGAWVIARRDVAATLPRHYVAALRLHGDAPPNELQVKLVDPEGGNVWWWRRCGFAFPRAASQLVLRRAGLEFAWGPANGGEPSRVGAVEVTVAPGEGGSGTLWIEDLRIEPREAVTGKPTAHRVEASSSIPGHEPAHLIEEKDGVSWRPRPGDVEPWLELDLGRLRDWGGLAVDFAAEAPACRVLGSDDGTHWTPLVDEPGGAGGRRWLRTGEAESRFVRLELSTADGVEITRLAVVPIEIAVAPARWAAAIAAATPRGRFPRHLLGEQAYWAVVGGDGDLRKGLLGEDGALEIDAEEFSLEPFLWTDGRLFTWADVERRTTLLDGCLPIASVDCRRRG